MSFRFEICQVNHKTRDFVQRPPGYIPVTLSDSFKSGYSDLGIKHTVPPSHRPFVYNDIMEQHYSHTATGIVQDSHLTSPTHCPAVTALPFKVLAESETRSADSANLV